MWRNSILVWPARSGGKTDKTHRRTYLSIFAPRPAGRWNQAVSGQAAGANRHSEVGREEALVQSAKLPIGCEHLLRLGRVWLPCEPISPAEESNRSCDCKFAKSTRAAATCWPKRAKWRPQVDNKLAPNWATNLQCPTAIKCRKHSQEQASCTAAAAALQVWRQQWFTALLLCHLSSSSSRPITRLQCTSSSSNLAWR